MAKRIFYYAFSVCVHYNGYVDQEKYYIIARDIETAIHAAIQKKPSWKTVESLEAVCMFRVNALIK